MKVGDLVRYTKEHSSQPGYDYCATWTGLLFRHPDDPVWCYRIYWTTPHGTHVGDRIDPPFPPLGLEVISESR